MTTVVEALEERLAAIPAMLRDYANQKKHTETMLKEGGPDNTQDPTYTHLATGHAEIQKSTTE